MSTAVAAAAGRRTQTSANSSRAGWWSKHTTLRDRSTTWTESARRSSVGLSTEMNRSGAHAVSAAHTNRSDPAMNW